MRGYVPVCHFVFSRLFEYSNVSKPQFHALSATYKLRLLRQTRSTSGLDRSPSLTILPIAQHSLNSSLSSRPTYPYGLRTSFLVPNVLRNYSAAISFRDFACSLLRCSQTFAVSSSTRRLNYENSVDRTSFDFFILYSNLASNRSSFLTSRLPPSSSNSPS